MKISIIVPVYNVEAYIEDCLRSVAAQTYNGEIECIIVNDCTTDNSCSIIERFIAGYNGNIQFTLLHHDKNRGLSAARNTGIDAATGEYVYFLDSDDEITTDCIELLAAPLTNKKYDFVIGNYKVIGSDKPISSLLLKNGTALFGQNVREAYLQDQWFIMAWNKLCRMDFIRKEKLNFKEGLTHEDNLWSFKLACTAQSLYVIGKITYKYKVRNTSIIGTMSSTKFIKAFTTITEEMYRFSKANRLLYEYDIVSKIIHYRNILLKEIFSQPSGKTRRNLYKECKKRIHIDAWSLFRRHIFNIKQFVWELHNYMPGTLGYWYLFCICKYYKKVPSNITDR